MKASNTVIGPDDDVLIPRGSTKTDWEVELAVIIGQTARYLDSPHDSLGVIAGFCVAGAGAWAAVTIGQATSTARGSNIRGTAESYLVSSQLAKL